MNKKKKARRKRQESYSFKKKIAQEERNLFLEFLLGKEKRKYGHFCRCNSLEKTFNKAPSSIQNFMLQEHPKLFMTSQLCKWDCSSSVVAQQFECISK
jgi:hypothetical protein